MPQVESIIPAVFFCLKATTVAVFFRKLHTY